MIGRFALACLDMAGTTVRDDGAVEAAFTAALAAVGIAEGTPRFEEAEDVVRRTMGWSKADVFATLLEPGAAGVKVCLTTGFAPTTRDALLDALGWCAEIDLALSPADVGRGRPAPDLILGAMARLGVDEPLAVAVVGDTVSDLEAGSAAGARAVVGVLSGAHDEATLEAAPHTAIIADVNGLLGVLEENRAL